MLKSLVSSVAAAALTAGAAFAQTAPATTTPTAPTPPMTATPAPSGTGTATQTPATPAPTSAAQTGAAQTGAMQQPAATGGQPFAQAEQTGTIFAALQSNPQFSTLVSALESTNLDDVLTRTTRAEGYTLFAPTNAAFESVPQAQRDALMNNPQALQALLLHHVVGTRVTAAQLRNERDGGRPLPMADNTTQAISGSGETVTLGGATVVQADVRAANGNIHVVDGLIMAAGTGAAAAPAAGATPAAGAAPATGATTATPPAATTTTPATTNAPTGGR